MEFLTQLWLPIVVSGVVVFFMSALAWTVLPHHKKDWQGLPNEDAVLAVMRTSPLAPGQYAVPFFDPKLREDPAMKERIAKGPNSFLTVIPSGSPAMGPMMAKSLVFYLIVSLLVAYVTWHALRGGTAVYLDVFRIVGTTAMMAYILAMVPESIWFGRPWRTFGLQAIDGIAYGLVTAGIFGWLWPK